MYWCGWGARATILFVGAGAAQDGIREAALESYAERLLLTSDLPRISGFTMRVCSGAVLRSPMTRSASLYVFCVGGVGIRLYGGSGADFLDIPKTLKGVSTLWRAGYDGKMRVLCETGEGLRRGARARRRWPAPGGSGEGRGCTCGCSRG